MIMKMIVINFKNYVSGERAFNLAKTVERDLSSAIICPDFMDIPKIVEKTSLRVFAQHVDLETEKKATGFIGAENLKAAGALGSLLNHSEHPLKFDLIAKTIDTAKKSGLKILLCATSLAEVSRFIPLQPWAIAFEDKKLIGTGRSITTYHSRDIKKFVKLVEGKRIIPLCGAGITTSTDVEEAYSFGCQGVLISSAIANSPNPERLLRQLDKF
jgi:triosephosphate isomerase